MYVVYILESINFKKVFYKGYTTDLKQRIRRHNSGEIVSTTKYKPWKIIFYSVFSDRNKALAFEKYLKSGSGIAFMRKRLI